MTSQTLRDARRYEDAMAQNITAEERPEFHLSPKVGWMNDPNGFSYYNGKFHLFYQYYPYDSQWGPMHWGHAVSDDLLHWEYLPAALAPDMPYDYVGCFSGSAVALPDGKQLFMYTGVRKEAQPGGGVRDIQTQCLAVGDGLDYEKDPRNPILTVEDMPENSSPFDFRDPKMWVCEDGTYRCVIVNDRKDGTGGRILLYKSADGYNWEFESIMLSNNGNFGKMWECPDFFTLDGKDVVLVSPQDMLPRDFEYHNGDGTLCLIGKFDEETKTFLPEKDQAVDYGIDFYAMQTVEAPDGRRIMIGWMQNWDTCSNNRIPKGKWFGQMSVPRELSIKNDRLIQKPVRELENLRTDKVEYKNVVFEDVIRLDGVKGRCVDMEITLRPGDGEDIYKKFAVRFAQNDTCHTAVSFRPYESVLKIDRKFSGSRRAIIHQRRSLVNSKNGELKLRLILDRYSAEIFVNDGEHVLTATLYTDLEADGISFFSDGKVEMDVTRYELKL